MRVGGSNKDQIYLDGIPVALSSVGRPEVATSSADGEICAILYGFDNARFSRVYYPNSFSNGEWVLIRDRTSIILAIRLKYARSIQKRMRRD